MNRWQARVSALPVGLVWALLYLVATESALRAGALPDLVDAAQRERQDPVLRDLWIEDPLLFFRLRPNSLASRAEWGWTTLRINQFGMRGPQVSLQKPVGVKRVAILGASALFGFTSGSGPHLMEERDTCARQLEATLTKDGERWEVLNAAQPAYSVLQGRRYLQRDLLPLEFDVIVIAYGWNDMFPATNGTPDSARPIRSWSGFHSRQLTRRWLTPQVVRQVTPVGDGAGARRDPGRPRRMSRQTFADNMADMVETCLDHGMFVILLTPPMGPLDAWAQGNEALSAVEREKYQRYMRIIRALARGWSVALADADAWISERTEYFDADEPNARDPLDVQHFNAAGHARIAAGLAAIIRGTFPPPTANAAVAGGRVGPEA